MAELNYGIWPVAHEFTSVNGEYSHRISEYPLTLEQFPVLRASKTIQLWYQFQIPGKVQHIYVENTAIQDALETE